MTQHMVDMTQQIAKGFELMGSQMESKGIIGDSGSSQSTEKKTMDSHEQDLIIEPMNFISHQGLLNLNLLFPKKRLTFNLKLIQYQRNGLNWMKSVGEV